MATSSRRRRAPTAGGRFAFTATAYCRGTTTASGVPVRSGIAAADPSLLPLGSIVDVAGTADPQYEGIYAVMDTGPSVQGSAVDLYIWNCDEAVAFGRQRIALTVLRLGWEPEASAPGVADRLRRSEEAASASAEQAEPNESAEPDQDTDEPESEDP